MSARSKILFPALVAGSLAILGTAMAAEKAPSSAGGHGAAPGPAAASGPEAHFVHKDKNGALGVLAVFIKVGDNYIALGEIWSNLPKKAGDEMKFKNVVINGRDLLPGNLDYYRLVGSLTSPPCSGGVQWHVLKTPIGVSRDQVRAFLGIIGKNARPVQKLGNRLLIDSVAGVGSLAGGSSGQCWRRTLNRGWAGQVKKIEIQDHHFTKGSRHVV